MTPFVLNMITESTFLYETVYNLKARPRKVQL